eukprot:7990253-Pyramimonas_sp.AAC.1
MVDSCAARSVCPPGVAPQIPRADSESPPLRHSDGAQIYGGGCKTVRMEASGTKQPVRGQFDVRDVHKAIIAVSDLA